MSETGTAESRKRVSFRRARSIGLLLVFFSCAAVVWFSTTSPGGFLDLFELGSWLGPASDMLAGKIPYRATFPIHGFLCDGGMDFLIWSTFGDRLSLSLLSHHFLEVFLHPSLFF